MKYLKIFSAIVVVAVLMVVVSGDKDGNVLSMINHSVSPDSGNGLHDTTSPEVSPQDHQDAPLIDYSVGYISYGVYATIDDDVILEHIRGET